MYIRSENGDGQCLGKCEADRVLEELAEVFAPFAVAWEHVKTLG